VSDPAPSSPVEAALKEMHAAAVAAGIGPGEPMARFVDAASLVARSIEQASTVYGERAVEAADAARQAAEAQLATLRAQVAVVTKETAGGISVSIRDDVVRELKGWTRKLDRRTALCAASVLSLAALLSGGAGYVAGWGAGRDQAVAAASGLQAAFAAEPEQASKWLDLMRLNDIVFAIDHCTPIKVQSGRACMVPLRLTPGARTPHV